MKNEKIIKGENAQIKKLHQIVSDSLKQEELIVENLLHPPIEVLTRGQSISDKVARFGGSWRFIIIFSVLLFIWILFNTLTPNKDEFDPYPFILMNLVLSAIAALQAPVIMMSQNRKEEKDRMRSENDYLVNLKAEMEIRSLHQKIDLLLEEQIKSLYNSQEKQFIILKDISRKIDILSVNKSTKG